MEKPTLSLSHFEVEGLVSLHRMNTITNEAKELILLELVKRYHDEGRQFDLYEVVLTFVHGNFTLGRTDLRLEKNFGEAGKTIGLLAQYEKDSNRRIPEQHAKHFFYFVKQFLIATERMLGRSEETVLDTSLQYFIPYYENLRALVDKQGGNNADSLATIDNALLRFRQKTQMSLPESTEDKQLPPVGEMALDKPLYKLSKGALTDILRNVYLYQKTDFYRIVESAFGKHDRYIFHDANVGFLPLLITAMESPGTKLNGLSFLNLLNSFIDDLKERNGEVKPEAVKSINFYPLEGVKTLTEFYQYVKGYIQNGSIRPRLSENEQDALLLRFLTDAKELAPEFVEEYLLLVTKYLKRIQAILPNSNRSLKDYLGQEVLFPDELHIHLQLRRNREHLTFEVIMRDGRFTGEYEGQWVRKKNASYSKDVEPKEPTIHSVGKLLSILHENLLCKLRPYYSIDTNLKLKLNDSYPFGQELEELLQIFEVEHFLLRIDDEELTKRSHPANGVDRGDNSFFKTLLLFRANYGDFAAEEIDILFGAESYQLWFPTQGFPTGVLKEMVEVALKRGVLDIEDDEKFAKCFQINWKSNELRNSFLADLCRKRSHETCMLIEAMIDPEHEKYTEVVNETIRQYFIDVLKRKNLNTANYIF